MTRKRGRDYTDTYMCENSVSKRGKERAKAKEWKSAFRKKV